MKIQNWITGSILFLLALTSCSNEVLERKDAGENGLVSINFTSGFFVQNTKATEQATEPEKNVDACFIGFYDTAGKLVASSYHTETQSTNGTLEKQWGETNQFRVTAIEVPMNKELKVVVIANPPKDYSNVATYESLLAETVAYTSGQDFLTNVSTLIKMGECSHTFTETNLVAQVDLIQLAAKIHVKLNFVHSETVSSLGAEIRGDDAIKVLNDAYSGSGTGGNIPESIRDVLQVCQGSGHAFGAKFNSHSYKGRTDWGNGVKWFVVKCNYVESSTYETWELQNAAIKISNLNLKTPYLFAMPSSNPFSEPGDLDINATIENDQLSFDFYTYQKEFIADNSEKVLERLKVTITGDLQPIEVTESKVYAESYLHAVWVDTNDTPQNGWSTGRSLVISYDEIIYNPDQWVDRTTSANKGNPLVGQNFIATINPAGSTEPYCTRGIIHGNYYEVTGTVKIEGPTSPQVRWEVVNMVDERIDVPSYN